MEWWGNAGSDMANSLIHSDSFPVSVALQYHNLPFRPGAAMVRGYTTLNAMKQLSDIWEHKKEGDRQQHNSTTAGLWCSTSLPLMALGFSQTHRTHKLSKGFAPISRGNQLFGLISRGLLCLSLSPTGLQPPRGNPGPVIVDRASPHYLGARRGGGGGTLALAKGKGHHSTARLCDPKRGVPAGVGVCVCVCVCFIIPHKKALVQGEESKWLRHPCRPAVWGSVHRGRGGPQLSAKWHYHGPEGPSEEVGGGGGVLRLAEPGPRAASHVLSFIFRVSLFAFASQ